MSDQANVRKQLNDLKSPPPPGSILNADLSAQFEQLQLPTPPPPQNYQIIKVS